MYTYIHIPMHTCIYTYVCIYISIYLSVQIFCDSGVFHLVCSKLTILRKSNSMLRFSFQSLYIRSRGPCHIVFTFVFLRYQSTISRDHIAQEQQHPELHLRDATEFSHFFREPLCALKRICALYVFERDIFLCADFCVFLFIHMGWLRLVGSIK